MTGDAETPPGTAVANSEAAVGSGKATSEGMSRADVEAVAALSAMQEGILFHALLGEAHGAYVNQHLIHLAGAADAANLHEAWLAVCRRHQVLRASFVWERVAKPMQVFLRPASVALDEVDLQHLSAEAQRAHIDAFLCEDKLRGFDLRVAPLMRLTLFRLSAERSILYWCNHHLILDGWSAAIVAREVFLLYAGRQRGTDTHLPAPAPFLQYLRWLQTRDVAEAEAFWRATLEGVQPTLFCTGGFGRTNVPQAGVGDSAAGLPSPMFEQVEVRLTEPETAALAACCRQLGVTQSVLCQAAWGSLLSLVSGTGDVVFGVTSSGRPADLPGVESMVGLFIATLPLRLRFAPEQTFAELLLSTQEFGMAARAYEFTSLQEVLRWAGPEAATTLFDTLLVFENYPVDKVLQTGAAGLSITEIEIKEATNYPLTLTFGPGRELTLQFTGLTGHMSREEVQSVAIQYRQHLLTLMQRPNVPLSSVSWLTTDVALHALAQGTGQRQHFGTGSVPDQIAAQAGATPNQPALTFENETLTYAQLLRQADRLASWLAERGIGPEVRCGVLAERGTALAVALLAVMRAGGCYLPLDPEHPPERLSMLVSRAAPALVLAGRACLDKLPPGAAPVFCLEEAIAAAQVLPATISVERAAPAPASSAYCIFTSGSTGEPKAVVNTHAGLWNRLQWMQQQFPIGTADTVLQKTPFTFDVSVWEFFWPWMTGRVSCLRVRVDTATAPTFTT